MVLTVLVVPVLMGAFLLLMERFEARLLGVAPPWDVDDELLGPDSNYAAAVGAAVGGAHLSQLRADPPPLHVRRVGVRRGVGSAAERPARARLPRAGRSRPLGVRCARTSPGTLTVTGSVI